jgi:N-acetylglucosaminyldiphosphoundecaprenol N-acetyl-beta-D-mannosaminyltransferase
MKQTAERAEVLGYSVKLGTLEGLLEAVWNATPQSGGVHVVTLNPEMIMRGQEDPSFGEILKNADCPIADGAGVVWALKRQGIVQSRLPGIELAFALLKRLHAEDSPRGVALLGAKPEVMNLLPNALETQLPNLKIAFAQDGFYPLEEEERLVENMVQAHPKLVLVALGVPRQETWIARYRHRFAEDTIFVGVGGSFDVWTGNIQRAPRVFQVLNLEWLWRFYLEPWRIQRSMKPLLQFVWHILKGEASC